MLRGLAMLVSNVARRFASRNQTSAAECDGSCDRLRETNVVLDQHQETDPAAASSRTDHSSNAKEGLMLRTKAQSAFVDSKQEAGLTGAAPRGQPPLGKGRSEPAKLATGGAHFVPHPQLSLLRIVREVTPTPTSLRTSRTFPFQGEVDVAPA